MALYLIVSNPVDIMTYVFTKISGLPEKPDLLVPVQFLTLHVCAADYPNISRLHRVISMPMYSVSMEIHPLFRGLVPIFQV